MSAHRSSSARLVRPSGRRAAARAGAGSWSTPGGERPQGALALASWCAALLVAPGCDRHASTTDAARAGQDVRTPVAHAIDAASVADTSGATNAASTTNAASATDAASTTGAPSTTDASSAAHGADAATTASAAGGPYNVLLISIDSLRVDMPWAGYPRPIAPNLTAFAARAVRYTHAYALSSYTSMSVGGMLAGRLPGELARSGFFFGHYPDSVEMFPERLRAAGVRTLAAQAHFYFRPGSAGFEQGFDVWQMVPGIRQNNTTDVDVTDDRQEALAERILGEGANTAGRFFAWFHFMGPHDEYIEHPGIGPYGRRMRDRYDGEVTFTDRQVGRLLDFVRAQPWGSRTVVIVTADHGEAFGEHNHYRHGFELWQELVRVPLLVALPGAAPREIDANRSHIDLAPTILELLGVAPAPSGALPGHSLVAELRGGDAAERDVWVDLPRTSDSDRRRALIHGRFKLIAYGDDERFEVYDTVADPGEAHNLRQTDRAAYDDMVARYRAAQADIHEVHPYQARNLRGAPRGRGW